MRKQWEIHLPLYRVCMEVSRIMSTTSSVSSLIKDYSYRSKTHRDSIAIAIVKDKPSAKEADAIIADCKDLIDDPKYNPFFYKKLYELGKARFMEQAYKARKYHRNGAGKFFVHLLK